MKELCELVPALLKLVVLLSDLELGLVGVVDDAHGGGKLPVELLLTRLENGDTRLKVKLLLGLC